jgi:hypothetical protein
MNGAEIKELIRSVNKRQDGIEEFSKKLQTIAGDMLIEVALCGMDLQKLHDSWPPQKWKSAFPKTIKMPYTTACRYIRIAANFDKLKLDRCKSLTECEQLITADRHCEKNGIPAECRDAFPPYLAVIKIGEQFVARLDQLTLKAVPAEGIWRLRELFEPTAKALWPANFTTD